jgi:hypothetical protein
MTLDSRVIASGAAPVYGVPRKARVGHALNDPDNCARQRAALARMDLCQRIVGLSREEIEAFHASQKAALLSRLEAA